jgi:hypothetical protein
MAFERLSHSERSCTPVGAKPEDSTGIPLLPGVRAEPGGRAMNYATASQDALSTEVAESTEDHTVWAKVTETPLSISSKKGKHNSGNATRAPFGSLCRCCMSTSTRWCYENRLCVWNFAAPAWCLYHRRRTSANFTIYRLRI